MQEAAAMARQPKQATNCATALPAADDYTVSPQQQRTISQKLLRWFHQHGRDLPWRENTDPYRVWVSEIMLQQTQVERVCDYFRQFLIAFPTVETLAAADEAEVLAAWQGLGYYRRARQLHACAKMVVSHHDGCFPETVDSLTALPGIGRYTASAISSIAFAQTEPIVEANSRRVIARLVGFDRPLSGTAGDAPLWEIAASLVPTRQAGRFNQALMDLGAMVCRPAAPSCHTCPLATACVAFRDGLTDQLPRMAKPRASVAVDEVALVVVRRNTLLLVQRGEDEWWAGLWDVPRAAPPRGSLLRTARREGRLLGEVRYGVTHHRIRADVVLLHAGKGNTLDQLGIPLASEPTAHRWVPLSGLPRIAMPSPARRIVTLFDRADHTSLG
jgi:A/G-specific adenine glycosylase